MTGYAHASTVYVNPPGAEPKITEAQLWKGLEFKAREPKEFVAMISACEVVEDHGANLVREVRFGDGPKVRETIESHEPSIVYFEMDTGTRVTNVVSYSPENELLLTFSFANGIPGVPGDQPRPTGPELNFKVGQAVAHSVEVIRRKVKAGEL